MISFYLLMTVMPMIRHPLWSEFVGDLTVIKYLGIVCLVYALFYLPFRSRPPQYFATWQARFFVAFSLLAIALFLELGAPIPLEISPLMSYASLLAFFFVTLTVVDSLHRLRWTLMMAIGSVAYASLHVIREWQKYGGMAEGYRPGWLTGDPNYYSASALLCVPLAYYMLQTKLSSWERWFCIGTLLATILGLTLAASRGGFVGMMVAILIMALRSRHRLRTLALAGVALLPLMVVAPSSPLTRLLNPDASDLISAQHRKNLARAGLDMFWSHPLTGVGPGNFKEALARSGESAELYVAHNTYVSVMAEMGLPGILLFTGVIVATFISLERARRLSLANDLGFVAATAEALEVGLVGFLVAAYFISAETHRFFWLMVVMSMVLPPLVKRRQSSATSSQDAYETRLQGLRRA